MRKKIVYESSEFILYNIQNSSNQTLVIIGTGNIIDWRPMHLQKPIYSNCSIYAMYFKKMHTGLEIAGRQLADYINTCNYNTVFFVGHSKCGVMAYTSLASNLKTRHRIFLVSAPLNGTELATPNVLKHRFFNSDKKLFFRCLSLPMHSLEYFIYRYLFYGNYPVDHDIALDSDYIFNNFNPLVLREHDFVNIVASCKDISTKKSIADLFLCWLDKRLSINGDGVVPLSSQLVLEPSYFINATHSSSLFASRDIIQSYINDANDVQSSN